MRTCILFVVLLLQPFNWKSSAAFAADLAPVTRWNFGAEETTPLKAHGGVHRDIPGPRPPTYPDFEPTNTAIRLDGAGAHLSYEDPGAASPFDFTNGDPLTLEAWVQVDELRTGENVYVIGKGRTGDAGYTADNQNWALRVRETHGKGGVSFLFATPVSSGKAAADEHWHRWTTSEGFKAGKGWHHVAVTYRFGDPTSIRGWIDGKQQPGAWDMGGPTEAAPIVDNDAIWIGSSRGGAAANSFRGSLDAVAIHRQILDDATLKARFRREGAEPADKPAPEVMPVVENLPRGQVLVVLQEGLPVHTRWLNEGESLPVETLRATAEGFLLDRLPQRYDSWGIRADWAAPVLMRVAADVPMAPGKQRFVMRVRGLSRLWIHGQVVARAEPMPASPNGEEPMLPVAQPPLPGLRSAEHHQQEVFADVDIDPSWLSPEGACRVVLETVVGGKALRTDPGETCVAQLSPDGTTYAVLRAGRPESTSAMAAVALTDHAVLAALARQDAAWQLQDDLVRRSAAASQDAFWSRRHAYARSWAEQHPAPVVPLAGLHPIDAFLQAKVDHALQESSKTPAEVSREFHTKILPLLRDECFRCHGEKSKAGLLLNSRAGALKGGDSELPAVMPGKPADSELIRRIRATDAEERMPPGNKPLTAEQIGVLETWVSNGAVWPAPHVAATDLAAPPVVDDASFLRRVFLDIVGIPPTELDLRTFLDEASTEKRSRIIDRLLTDERWADHWVSYWQDVLAENPTLLNASLNTTGPFRWFLYETLRDNKAFDRFVTELILQRGSKHEGGSAGFGIAADNDAPFAAKGQIIASAFLGIELQCARCHDSPYHSTKQADLYALAAMLERKPLTVPKSSRVPKAFFEQKARESLIRVTLNPEQQIAPTWPFAELTGSLDDGTLATLLQQSDDTRERFAALVTSPHNERFAQVLVNRVWRRLMGAGLVEPPQDWEGHVASHPELLQWLAHEFLTHDYDLKHLTRLILTSQTYQRAAIGRNRETEPALRFFVAPDRRRLTAEQVVDSLFAATGRAMDVEEITFDPDARRPASNRLTLGVPRRAWMFASLANERDRPSLSLPRARAVADLLEAFGWSGSRQNPRTDRESAAHVLQPGVLANSVASVSLTRIVQGSGLADLAVSSRSPDEIVDSLFVRFLSRRPTDGERGPLVQALAVGFSERLVPETEIAPAPPLEVLPRVTWSNHLRPESSTIALELERRARLGPPADPRLRTEWREVLEDVIWSLVNLREFVWVP